MELIKEIEKKYQEVKSRDEIVDAVEAMMSELPSIDCPLIHRFTPNLYTREIFMAKGSFITSKIHLTEHQFIVSKGKCTVWTDVGEQILIEAPYHGITKPNTRRVLFVHEDCIWTTFHVTDVQPLSDSEQDVLEAVNKIENVIIEKHENIFLNNKNKEELWHG